jgi:membrane-bound hydrogenase subunit beta
MTKAKKEQLDAKGLVKYFKDEFKTKILKAGIKKQTAGTNKNEYFDIWMKIDKSIFKKVMRHLCDYQFPHLAVVSGNDLGKNIELIYHFSVNFGERFKEISLNIAVDIPKNKPEIETICDLIPGALITEREKQEMLGVKVIGIPDDRRLFLPKDFPKDVYPWRKDKQPGLEKLIRNLHDGVKK